MAFEEIDLRVPFSKIEEQMLSFWKKENIFERSVIGKKESEKFFFYDGPPFATGLPHYGNILAGTIKDVIPRYQTMLGKKVERKFGWDCHGLPVEFEAEKELGFQNGRKEIEEMGIAKFNEYCRSIVLRYTKEWKKSVVRMGRWADLENPYKTMDLNFMESIWWVFQSLWKKKLIYQGSKIVAYSTRLQTPLSNFEVNLNYKEVQDPSVVVKFPLAQKQNEFFLAWTTTPWTLPSNLGLCVHSKIIYAKVEFENSIYYLAESLVSQYFKVAKILERMNGGALAEIEYHPLFPYFQDAKKQGAFRIFCGDFVSEKTGTGIVHCAPMFGEDDFIIGKKYQLPQVLPLDESGVFDNNVKDFQGMYFKDADKKIIAHLKEKGLLFSQSTIVHNYPFCWRSNTPLIYRAIPTWFVAVTKLKEIIIANNQKVHWVPSHIRQGRMGKWLEGARDWAISRNRYWGTPIPIWQCNTCQHQVCIGSRAELEQKTNTSLTDLHRHFIDKLSFKCPKCTNSMKRVPEILDCWFESGAMPYGQEHYPFKNKNKFDKIFPADFVSEGLDQTRGWFYTLIVLSNALFQKSAFKNIIVSGMLLAEDGKKMSKSLKNYPDPNELIEKYGADNLRFYLLNCAAVKAEEYKFSEKSLREISKNNLIPLWNVLSFFTTYANIDNWQPQKLKDIRQLTNPLDIWIIAKLHQLILKVRTALDDYDLNRAVQPFFLFIEELTNWYVRRSRRRFWKSEKGADKNNAYLCLFEVLSGLSKLLAPFTPFLADKIYQVLHLDKEHISVHLNSFPIPNKNWLKKENTSAMDEIIVVVNLGRSLRANAQIKLRQPLSKLILVTNDQAFIKRIIKLQNLITQELNVKKIEFLTNEQSLLEFTAKINFSLLGPKFGKKISQVQKQIHSLSSAEVFAIYQGQDYNFSLENKHYKIAKEHLFFSKKSKNDLLVESNKNITVILDTETDEDLVLEGAGRDLIHWMQQERKKLGLKITNRINMYYLSNHFLEKIFQNHQEYIKQETLCQKFVIQNNKENLKIFCLTKNKFFLRIQKI